MGSSPGRAVEAAAGQLAEVRDWLQRVAACLGDPARQLPSPPHTDLDPVYQAILTARQQLEKSQHDLIESIQMQCLQMVGSMLTHDLHNLSLRLALLSQNLERFYGDPAFLQSAKRVLDDTVQRMRGLVDNFRERQENLIIKIPTDLADVVRVALRQAEVSQSAGVRVFQDYRGVPRVWADPFFLANALRVLIENAVEAMPQGGELTLRTHAGDGADGMVHVEVEDTGIGMTPEFVKGELFAPFRTSKGRGLGLGMYICQQIIQLHEGKIHVETAPGRGTCFRLSFSAIPEQA